jgi:Na+/H+ antiporter NhaD/arsenite permease-like protein
MHGATEVVHASHEITLPILIITLLIFIGSYALIVSERIHRTIIAIFGGALIVLIGSLMKFYTQDAAFAAIDFNTIGLLIGMMIIVAITKDTGIFQYVAIKAAKMVKGDPWKIMIVFSIITAVFSALLDNVTTVLLIVPMTFVICNNLRINPLPFLFVEILMSNIGGTATLIGDPPNILIGSAANLSFMQFVVNLGPAALIVFIVTMFYFKLKYKKQICARKENIQKIMRLNENETIKNPKLLKKSLLVLAITLLGFFFHGMLHLEAASIALFGAGFLMLLDKKNPEKVLHEVEWITIFFFAGLFVLVGSLESVGVINFLAEKLIEFTQGSLAMTAGLLLWGGAIFSAFVDNIPFVATMIPLVQDLKHTFNPAQLEILWWSLALGACFGGNGTLVGASANLVVAGMAEKSGYKISFKEFMKVGLIVMTISVAIAHIYLSIRYL